MQVANRQTWTVQDVGQDGTVWATENATGRQRQRTVRLPAAYVAEHTHLTYAATAYGVQSATVPASHTVPSDALDASGVYVGMTRGRQANYLHVVADDVDDAREQFVLALERDRADRGLAAATQTAREAVAGLTDDGPVRVVNIERTRLGEQIERADQRAARWEHAAAALNHQAQGHRAEADERQSLVTAAEQDAQRVRAEVLAPLVEQATADGTAYLAARSRVWEAPAAHRDARGLRKRNTARALSAAVDEHRSIETAARRRWGTLPETTAALASWAASVAQQEADADPRVTEVRQRVDDTRQDQQHLTARQSRERADLRRQVLGDRAPSSTQAQAVRWRAQAEAARHNLAEVEALPITEAARLLRDRAARATAERTASEPATAATQAPVAEPDRWYSPSPGHRPSRERDLGPSL